MKKRLFLWGGLALVCVCGIAFAVPDSRYRLLALLRNEPLVHGRPVHFWLETLTAGDAEQRRQAALNLGEAGVCKKDALAAEDCKQVVAALVEALGDEDGFVRKCAATSFLLLPQEAVVAPTSVARMTAALQDNEPAVRRAAVRGLWQAGTAAKDGDGLPRLTTALDDTDEFVRMYACRAIGKIGPGAYTATPSLLERLRKDEDSDVRKLAAKSLGLIGSKGIGRKNMPEVVAALKDSLKAQNRGLREYAARALGELGARDAVPALRDAALDPDAGVRGAASEALKRLET